MKTINRNAEPFFWEGEKDIACLLIHGFTGSPADMKVLGTYLLERGYGVSGLLLPGHGTTPEDLATKRWPDWFKAVEVDYLKLQQSYRIVIPMGLSMGGVLSLHLAAQYKVQGLVSLSAPVFLHDERIYKSEDLELEFYRKERTPEAKAHLLAEGRFSYDAIPLKALSSLIELIDLVKEELGEIKGSSLIFQSKDDPLVNPKSAQYIYDYLGSKQKELNWLEKSRHVITLGAERQKIFETIELFLQRGLENAV